MSWHRLDRQPYGLGNQMADYPWRTAVVSAVLLPFIALVRTGLFGVADVAACVRLGALLGAFAGWTERWRQIHYGLRVPRGHPARHHRGDPG